MFKKVSTYIFSALFVLVLILPMTNKIFGIWNFERKEENRVFKDDLKIRLDNLDFFPKDCEDYINDNFSFRSPALDIYHQIKYHVFSVSPNKNKTIIGSDNWFFEAGKEQKELEGKRRFNSIQLNTIKQEWRRRSTYLNNKEIKHYWIVAPFKHYVYPEFLPKNIFISDKQKRVDQLENSLKDEFPFLLINPTNALIKEKESHRVFYQMDNHWNYRAGEIVSKILLNKLRTDFPQHNLPPLFNFEWKDSLVKDGNQYFAINIPSLFETIEIPNIQKSNGKEIKKYGYRDEKKFPFRKDYESRYTSEKPKTNLRILFICDSFGNHLKPFISDYFTESLFIFDSWNYYLNENIIESYKPDIVVFLNLETHTDSYLNNATK